MSETNGARDVACFKCRNAIPVDQYVERIGGGFHHQYRCSKGLHMPDSKRGVPDEDIVVRCPGADPQAGFQIGGYYSHMWFESDGDCLKWLIYSDGLFPTDLPDIEFHICDFAQLERFVAFWGKELRRRGIVE